MVQAAAFPFPSPQGSQVYVRGMARALARRGHRVIVACYGFGQGEPDGDYTLLRAPAPRGYSNLRAGPDLTKPWLDLAMAAQLLRLRPRPDLIHAHNYEAPLAAWPACRLRGIPLLYNNHNTMSEELHRYFTRPAARSVARAVGRGLDRSVPRLADAAVAISEQAVPILESLGCPRVHHVPPGVDPADLEGVDGARARARYGLEGRPWVVYAGNPDAYQDLEVLVDAVARLEDLGLLMVSASPMDRLERRAEALLPPARRRFVRTASWPEVRDLIAAADLAALPRAVCSGYPIKLLNYLGLGRPTVCARGSARDIAGVVEVPNHDVPAFADALAALARDPAGRQALGARARVDILARFTWDAVAARLEQVYATVVRTRRGATAG